MTKTNTGHLKAFPPNTKHLYKICTMLNQHGRRWAGVVQILHKCFAFVVLKYLPYEDVDHLNVGSSFLGSLLFSILIFQLRNHIQSSTATYVQTNRRSFQLSNYRTFTFTYANKLLMLYYHIPTVLLYSRT